VSDTTVFYPAAVSLRKGDTMLIAFAVNVPASELDHFTGVMEDVMPGIKFVCVDNVAGLARYRPEDGEG
jgi:hypothetical protein